MAVETDDPECSGCIWPLSRGALVLTSLGPLGYDPNWSEGLGGPLSTLGHFGRC